LVCTNPVNLVRRKTPWAGVKDGQGFNNGLHTGPPNMSHRRRKLTNPLHSCTRGESGIRKANTKCSGVYGFFGALGLLLTLRMSSFPRCSCRFEVVIVTSQKVKGSEYVLATSAESPRLAGAPRLGRRDRGALGLRCVQKYIEGQFCLLCGHWAPFSAWCAGGIVGFMRRG
jgi:hypothetical protein